MKALLRRILGTALLLMACIPLHAQTVSGPDHAGAFHFVDGTDEETEYEYDPNGNMTKDSNKGISSIQYNLLNLPSTVWI